MRPLALTAATTVTALGHGNAAMLSALRERRTGLAPLDLAELGPAPPWPTFVGAVPGVAGHGLPDHLARFACRNNILADLALRTDGFDDAVASARDRYGPGRVAVVVGTSTSGILSGEQAYRARDPSSGRLPDWFDYAATQDLASLAQFVRAALRLSGPSISLSTACASSAKSLMHGAQLIAGGLCDAVVVGGADSLCAMTLMGFAALDLLSATPCRPCDVARSGISLGEAAGFALLERPDSAPSPVAMLLGCGASSDGFHMSAPDPRGTGAAAAMRAALRDAAMAPAAIDYVNLHGTGTKANDAMEDLAVCSVFGTGTPCSSTKAWTGHTLGAAGIVEAVVACLSIADDLVPGCLGIEQVDPQFRARVLTGNLCAPVRHVMSNSFGFGGINCSLLFGAAA